MKGLVIVFLALVACAAAVPKISARIDLYRNTLQKPDLRIIGGVQAERNQFPHQVSVEWGIFGTFSHVCGGVLIKPNWVLTAGHCDALPVGSYRVVLGQLELGEEHKDIQIIGVDKFIVHPNYPGDVAANDIALLRLKGNAFVSDAVQFAELPTEEQCDALEKSILSGWGLTSSLPFPPKRLRYAVLPRISFEVCKNSLIALLGESGPLDDTMICTGSQEGTAQSACSGDSGGPLILKSSNGTVVIGIVSWGISPCGTEGAPSVYTRVCSHRKFIESIIESKP